MSELMKPARLNTKSLMKYFEHQITSGLVSEGIKLPSERILSKQFNLSRGSVRRALQGLVEKGYVDQKPGSGTYVIWKVADKLPLSRGINSPATSHETQVSPYELMEARCLIEPLMPPLIVKKGTAQNFARMRECLERSEKAETTEEFEFWDGELHRELALATHNTFFHEILRLTNLVREQGEWGRLKKLSLTPERRKNYECQHRKLVEALQDRDANQATSLIQQHLDEIMRNLFDT